MPDSTPPRLVYYDFPTSPFCAKVRSVLMYQRAGFETVSATAPRHWMALRRRGTGKVPALEIDGRLVSDSTDICHALDALFPQRPVLPNDARERALCHAIEEWCDESLYFVGLHHVWLDPGNAPAVRGRFAPGPLGWLAWRAYRRLIRIQVRGQGTARSPIHTAPDGTAGTIGQQAHARPHGRATRGAAAGIAALGHCPHTATDQAAAHRAAHAVGQATDTGTDHGAGHGVVGKGLPTHKRCTRDQRGHHEMSNAHSILLSYHPTHITRFAQIDPESSMTAIMVI